jgi:hypothetical protein
MSSSHAAWIGLHCQIAIGNRMISERTRITITVTTAMRNGRCGKMRRYRKRMDILTKKMARAQKIWQR